MPIPKILHQTWKTREIPDQFRSFRDSWRRHHPAWEIRIYDNDDCRRLVAERRPQLLAAYDGLPTAIQRADVFRYVVMFECGGLYADLDMESFKSVDPLLEARSCVFGIEATFGDKLRRRLNYREPYQVANCIFAAVPHHPFFGSLLDQLAQPTPAMTLDSPVEDTTGPRFLTRFFSSVAGAVP